jgi:hypothetical protein
MPQESYRVVRAPGDCRNARLAPEYVFTLGANEMDRKIPCLGVRSAYLIACALPESATPPTQ